MNVKEPKIAWYGMKQLYLAVRWVPSLLSMAGGGAGECPRDNAD